MHLYCVSYSVGDQIEPQENKQQQTDKRKLSNRPKILPLEVSLGLVIPEVAAWADLEALLLSVTPENEQHEQTDRNRRKEQGMGRTAYRNGSPRALQSTGSGSSMCIWRPFSCSLPEKSPVTCLTTSAMSKSISSSRSWPASIWKVRTER